MRSTTGSALPTAGCPTGCTSSPPTAASPTRAAAGRSATSRRKWNKRWSCCSWTRPRPAAPPPPNPNTLGDTTMKRNICFIVLALAFLPGCGRGPGAAADPDTGEKALLTALDAWKSGKSQQDIANGSPSIIMNEDDWRTGKRLLEFKVVEGSMDGRQVMRKVQIK